MVAARCIHQAGSLIGFFCCRLTVLVGIMLNVVGYVGLYAAATG